MVAELMRANVKDLRGIPIRFVYRDVNEAAKNIVMMDLAILRGIRDPLRGRLETAILKG